MADSKTPQKEPNVPAANAQNDGLPENSEGVVVGTVQVNPAAGASPPDIAEVAPEPVDPDADWRDLKVGSMGASRVRLMQALGVDVNHPYDRQIDEKLKELIPDYQGTLTLEMLQALEGREMVTSKA